MGIGPLKIIKKKSDLKNHAFSKTKHSDLKDDILGNPKSQVGQYAKQLFDKYQVFDDCNEEYMNDNQKKICKNEMARGIAQALTYVSINSLPGSASRDGLNTYRGIGRSVTQGYKERRKERKAQKLAEKRHSELLKK